MQDVVIYVIIAFVVCVCVYMYYQNSDTLQLKCIVSSVDGNKYCVRDRSKLQEAADLLATVTQKCKDLIKYMHEKHPDEDRTKRLVNGFNPKTVMETLPTSSFTAYSENKGQKIAFCLSPTKTKGEDTLIDEHTLMFVAIHELAHVATVSIGHKTDFWDNFKYLLENAKEAGIHEPKDYKNAEGKYCSMKLKDNPFYDL